MVFWDSYDYIKRPCLKNIINKTSQRKWDGKKTLSLSKSGKTLDSQVLAFTRSFQLGTEWSKGAFLNDVFVEGYSELMMGDKGNIS